jgi:hypothetical protein
MRSSHLASVVAVGLLAIALPMPAAAQFAPNFNNLKCYKISGPSLAVNLQLDNQFGRERVFKLVPQFLCVPTQKSCCSPPPVQCSPALCNPEPSPNQPAPVDHFKCYKIQEKQCTPTIAGGFDCNKLTGHFPPAPPDIVVTLRDQFHDETVKVQPPKMLCVPVLKIRQTTTTTTTSTTTTTRPCRLAGPAGMGVCGGDCPPGFACLLSSPTSTICECIPNAQACDGPFPNCGGGCPGQADLCHPPPGVSICECCTQPGGACSAATVCCSGNPCGSTGTCP